MEVKSGQNKGSSHTCEEVLVEFITNLISITRDIKEKNITKRKTHTT